MQRIKVHLFAVVLGAFWEVERALGALFEVSYGPLGPIFVRPNNCTEGCLISHPFRALICGPLGSLLGGRTASWGVLQGILVVPNKCTERCLISPPFRALICGRLGRFLGGRTGSWGPL